MRALPDIARRAAILGLLGVALAGPAAAADPSDFRRGVNIGDYLAYPRSRSWPYFAGRDAEVELAELKKLEAAGFAFVRLPVEPAPFFSDGGANADRLSARLVAFLDDARTAGLAVIVTGFPRHELPEWSQKAVLADPAGSRFRDYQGFLTRLAEILVARKDEALALELMNEPQPECRKIDGPDWRDLQRRLYEAVRGVAPKLTIVLTGGCWSSIDGLEGFDLSGYDRNILVDLHFYEPFKFTHQGATWTVPELRFAAGLSFPAARTKRSRAQAASRRLFAARRGATDSDLAATLRAVDAHIRERSSAASISTDMDRIEVWAKQQNVPNERIIVGEFGALRQPAEARVSEDGSRARWLRTVRRAAELRGFGWAHWAYRSPFGLFADGDRARYDPATLKALGLRQRP